MLSKIRKKNVDSHQKSTNVITSGSLETEIV